MREILIFALLTSSLFCQLPEDIKATINNMNTPKQKDLGDIHVCITKSSVDIKSIQTSTTKFDSDAAANGLTVEVAEKLKLVVFAESVNYHSFSFSIDNTPIFNEFGDWGLSVKDPSMIAKFDEYIGSAKNENGNIHIILAIGQSEGTVWKKYAMTKPAWSCFGGNMPVNNIPEDVCFVHNIFGTMETCVYIKKSINQPTAYNGEIRVFSCIGNGRNDLPYCNKFPFSIEEKELIKTYLKAVAEDKLKEKVHSSALFLFE